MTDRAATFLFGDIAGFTALTEAHGDEEAATLVTNFCEAVNAELPAGAAHACLRGGLRQAITPPMPRHLASQRAGARKDRAPPACLRCRRTALL